MKQSTVVEATTTHEITLKPTTKRRLLQNLKAYQELKNQREVIEAAIKKHKALVEEDLLETGEQKLDIEGFKVALVSPVTSKLDKKKLLEAGVTMAQLEEGTVITPGRSYVKVTVPGEKDRDY